MQPQAAPAPAPAPPAVANLATEQQAILKQVLQMTQEQIDALPEVQRAQVLQVKQLLIASGAVPH